MGRKKTPTSTMNVAEKQNTDLAKRLDGLITDANALKNYLGISAQAINQYRLGISRPSLENLCKIADYYHVTTDYLLGRTDVKTISAICFLQAVTEIPASSRSNILKAINALLSEAQFEDCMNFWDRMSRYLFTSSVSYNVQFENSCRTLDADTVLSLLLVENDQYLLNLRKNLRCGGGESAVNQKEGE